MNEIFFFQFLLFVDVDFNCQNKVCRMENVTAGQQTGRGSDERGACFGDKAAP